MNKLPGKILKAPEYFLTQKDIQAVKTQAPQGRRDFLSKAFAAVAGMTASAAALAQHASEGDTHILNLPAHATGLGQGVASPGYGKPSQFEANLQRRQSPGLTQTTQASVSFAPLQSLFGIVTPSGLHFERHHQGWWDIDPTKHRFMVQYTHGMLSCSEFTGVPLITLLEHCGADLKAGQFVLAEGGDGSSMTRTIPMSLIKSGEVLVAYGQNGEMLRPENGYPLRLVVPGVQGVSWVKYLRRIELGDKPYGTKDEAIHYIDLMPDGSHRQYSGIQECKSVVTTPSGGQALLDKGFYNITGLAWSGRGAIKKVDVSVDGGANWIPARLESPVLSKCLTRFNLDWVWDGKPSIIQSRATDDTGYVQPTIKQLREVRGTRSIYHNNAIQSWLVQESGEVKNVQVS